MRMFIFVVSVAISCFVQAQQVFVCDQKTHELLPYASMSGDNGGLICTSNTAGYIVIDLLEESSSITVSMLGYYDRETTYNDLCAVDTFFLEKKSYALSPVEVTSLRQANSIEQNAVRIDALSQNDITLYLPQTSADLLGLSDEVFIQKSQQGGGSPMIRGFATNRLLYTVDGVRMNTAIFRSGNLQNVISLDAYSMASAKVLLGANSVIYGSDAVGGVMAFDTKQATLSKDRHFALQFNTGTATANTHKMSHLDLAYGNAKISGLTSVSYQHYGDVKMGSTGPNEYLQHYYVKRVNDEDVVLLNPDNELQRPNDFSQLNLMQKVHYVPNAAWDIYYGFHYSTTGDYARYDRLIQTKNDLPKYAEWKYGPQRWMMNHLNLHYLTPTVLFDDIELKLAHQHFEESRISRKFRDDDQKIREEQVEAFSLNADFSKRYYNHHFYYGFEVVTDRVHSFGWQKNIIDQSRIEAASRYPQALWSSYALFFNDELQLDEKLYLNLGARYNLNAIEAQFDTRYYDFPFTESFQLNQALTWNLGLQYRPGKQCVLGARIATAFRSPNVDDMGKVFDSEPGSVIVPHLDLKPEYAYNFELQGKQQLDRASIEVSLYYTWLNHAFVRQAYNYNGQDSMLYDGEMSKVYALQNAAHAYVYGASVLAQFDLPYSFKFVVSYHYQYGKEETEEGQMSYARHVAPNYGRIGLKYKSKGLEVQLYTIYNAEIPYSRLALSERSKPHVYAQDAEGNPYAPAWYTLNLKGSYRFTEMLKLSIGIDNMTDQRYRPYSSGLAALGRNFSLSVQLNL